MENIITKTSEQFGTIRQINGKPALWCGSDVAKALGYARPNDAISAHCRCTVKRRIPHPQSPSKQIEVSFIPEADVYRLICHSKLPKAQEFEKWVFEDVVPSAVKGTSCRQMTFDDYSYFDKKFRGKPVLSVADISAMLNVDRSTLGYSVRRYLKQGQDYYLLEKTALVEFKLENPKVFKHIGSMYVVTESGFDKLCKLYGVKVDKPKMFIEEKPTAKAAYKPNSSMISLLGYLDRDIILINEYCRRILNANSVEDAQQSRTALAKAMRSLRQYTVDVESIMIK